MGRDPAAKTAGVLYLVATPIGNLGDLSPRAVETLGRVDLVACEDTRRTGRLLARLQLKAALRSLHEHNEKARSRELLAALTGGRDVALVSDAGTPLVSDPGFLLVREAAAANVPIRVVPGPSAALAALSASALPPQPFTFLGFPPPRSGKRRRFFERYADLEHTLVLFESPHRLLRSLDDALAVFGNRQAVVARELTKLHEEFLRGELAQIREQLAKRPALKGEFVLVLAGYQATRSQN